MASKAGSRRNPAVGSDGVPVWQPSSGRHIQAGSNVARSRHRCLVPACGDAWRFLAKWFCGFGFAWPAIAGQPSFSVRSCDRGQRYCSLACRRQARLGQRRRANRRHQRSLEGRLDHRDRQREYRQRRAQAPVTDHGSLSIASPASSACGMGKATVIKVPPRSNAAGLPRWPEKLPGIRLCCRICGRSARFIDPFHEHSTTKVRSTDDQSRNPCANSPLLLRRTLEDRHHRQRTGRTSRHGAQCHRSGAFPQHAATASVRGGSVRRVHPPDPGPVSAPARYPHLPDGPRSRLHRQRRPVAARGGPPAPVDPRAIPAPADLSRRAGDRSTGRISVTSWWAAPAALCPAS